MKEKEPRVKVPRDDVVGCLSSGGGVAAHAAPPASVGLAEDAGAQHCRQRRAVSSPSPSPCGVVNGLGSLSTLACPVAKALSPGARTMRGLLPRRAPRRPAPPAAGPARRYWPGRGRRPPDRRRRLAPAWGRWRPHLSWGPTELAGLNRRGNPGSTVDTVGVIRLHEARVVISRQRFA